MESKQEQRRKRVYEFYEDNRDKGKTFTVKHFLAEKVPKRTIYRLIDSAENESGPARAPGTGRKATVMTKQGIKKLTAMFDQMCNISQRQAARKFKCSQAHVSKRLAKKASIQA